jgi:hypothetical protein
VSAAQARVITRTVFALPARVQDEHAAAVQTLLVGQATRFDPQILARLAREIEARLNPDGRHTDEADQARRRELRLRELGDGAFSIAGRLTPECGALLQAALDPLAAPCPAVHGAPDQRTPAQRRHDALQDLAARSLAAGDLPASGAPVTLLIRVNAEDLAARTGYGSTSFGGTISLSAALRLSGEAHLVAAARSMRDGTVRYGRDRRIASHGQTLALIARDGGCTFPGVRREALVDQVEVRDLRRSSVAAVL